MAELLTGRANKCGLRITAKSILQEKCQFGVTEWDMGIVLSEGFNDEA